MTLSGCSNVPEVLLGENSMDRLFEERHALLKEHRRLELGDPKQCPPWKVMHDEYIAMDNKIKDTLLKRGPSAIPGLIKRMKGPDASLSENILIALGPESIAPVIEYARKDGDITNAGIVLIGIGKSCVEPLYKELASEQAHMRDLALNVLIELAGLRLASDKSIRLPPIDPYLHQTAHYDEIMKALDIEQDPSLKAKLVVLFGASSKPDVPKRLMEMIENETSPEVHYQATGSLIAALRPLYGDQYTETCEFLLKRLETEKDEDLRAAILDPFVSVSSRFKPPMAVLRKSAADPASKVRIKALKAIFCNYGDDKAVQKEMISLLKEGDSDTKGAVRLCVYYLNDRDNHPQLEPELDALVYHNRK